MIRHASPTPEPFYQGAYASKVRAGSHAAGGAHVIDLQPDPVTAPELAVDGEIERCQVLNDLLRNSNWDPDILNLANGRLEQDAKKQEACFVPYRVVHGVIVTFKINLWQSPIWRIIGYINL